MTDDNLIHNLRNPYGRTEEEMRSDRVDAALRIETTSRKLKLLRLFIIDAKNSLKEDEYAHMVLTDVLQLISN